MGLYAFESRSAGPTPRGVRRDFQADSTQRTVVIEKQHKEEMWNAGRECSPGGERGLTRKREGEIILRELMKETER